MKKIFLNLLIFMSLTACTAIHDGHIKPPLVYRIDIQQGNVVDQSMVNKLKVGMDEKQVRFIMGTPLLIDPFHPERWDYLYFFQEGGKDAEQRHITVYFEEGKLSHLTGDIKASHIPVKEDVVRTEKSIVVPEGYEDKGILEGMFNRGPKLIEKPESDTVDATELKEDVLEETKDEVVETAEEDITEATDTELDTAELEALELENMELENMEKEFNSDATETVETETQATEESVEEEAEEPGFFSRMWDKITSDEEPATDDTGALEPEFEQNK